MSAAANRMGTEWLGAIGVGLGLVVALFVDQMLVEALVDRPVMIVGVTALVAMLFIAMTRVFLWPIPAAAHRNRP